MQKINANELRSLHTTSTLDMIRSRFTAVAGSASAFKSCTPQASIRQACTLLKSGSVMGTTSGVASEPSGVLEAGSSAEGAT